MSEADIRQRLEAAVKKRWDTELTPCDNTVDKAQRRLAVDEIIEQLRSNQQWAAEVLAVELPGAGTVACPNCGERVPVLVPFRLAHLVNQLPTAPELYEWLSGSQRVIADACCYHDQLQHYPRMTPTGGS